MAGAAWLVVTETNLYVPFLPNSYIPLGPFYSCSRPS
jgi:phospho-N-acetylmuramoyl-pentapeptide-transferase